MTMGDRIGDRIKALWRDASTAKRALFVSLPILVVVLLVVGVSFAVSGGGGEASSQQVVAPTETMTETAVPSPTVTPHPTETPASAGLQHSAPPPGTGSGSSGRPVVPQSGSGPGAPTGTGMSLVISSIGVNAPVYGRTVGTNGQMGNPSGPWDVIWYDFSQNWPGLGGFPGQPGSNAVFAGHVDYIHVGPAVFWSLRNLAPGAQITVNTNNGPVNYVVDWSQWADPNADFTQYVSKSGGDLITLVTCIGTFSGHEYSNRFIVRGHRV